MNIRILAFSLIFASATLSFGQSAVEGRYALTKKVSDQATGVSILLNGSPEYIEAALAEKFSAATKDKPKNMGKGVLMYEAVILPQVSASTLNYYYRIEEAGSGAGKMTQVTFFVSPGHDNFYSSEKYPNEMQAAERMLSSLDQSARRMEVQAAIDAQATVIADQEKEQLELEKEQKNLEKEKENLAKELEKLQKSIIENQSAIDQNAQKQATQKGKMETEVKKMQELQQDISNK